MEKMTKEELAEAFNEPKIGKTYKHFKGEEYLVLDRIPDGEKDGEITIVYKNLTTNQRYTRSLSSWNSPAQVTRFEKSPSAEQLTYPEDWSDRDVKIANFLIDLSDQEVAQKNLKNADKEVAFGLAAVGLENMPEFKTLKGDGFHLGDLKELNPTLEKQDPTAGTCITVKNLKRDIKFQTYIRKEIISAKVLESSDIDGFGETVSGVLIGYIYGPKQESGKVVEHSGIVNEDYLIRGEGYIKIMNKEKFEAKYKLEVPF